MNEYLDLTSFMWKPVAWDDDQLRILLYCADGLAGELQARLKEIGVVATKKNRCCLEIARQRSVEHFIEYMDILPSYRQVWHEYFQATELIHRGVKADQGRIEERRRAVRRVLAAAPKLDHESSEGR